MVAGLTTLGFAAGAVGAVATWSAVDFAPVIGHAVAAAVGLALAVAMPVLTVELGRRSAAGVGVATERLAAVRAPSPGGATEAAADGTPTEREATDPVTGRAATEREATDSVTGRAATEREATTGAAGSGCDSGAERDATVDGRRPGSPPPAARSES